jgi:hypothetical protein
MVDKKKKLDSNAKAARDEFFGNTKSRRASEVSKLKLHGKRKSTESMKNTVQRTKELEKTGGRRTLPAPTDRPKAKKKSK